MEKIFFINGNEVRVKNYILKDNFLEFELNGKKFIYNRLEYSESLLIEGDKRFISHVAPLKGGEQVVIADGIEARISSGKRAKKQVVQGSLNSPMPGKIFKIIKDVGEEVKKGDTILILEAMKMEHSIRADKDGVVKTINFKVGELVQGGAVLAKVE